MTLLITGGAGFIGSNFVRYILGRYGDYKVVNYDKLTYAGNLENLADISSDPRYVFVKGDICDEPLLDAVVKDYGIDVILNFAAESHVDRSILGAAEFVQTNIVGTQVLLDVVKKHGLRRYVQVSTDEVYGSLGPSGAFTETTPLHPNSPYAASKASADLLVQAYHHTFGLPLLITRCSNNYGPYQFPEKLIPLMIINAMQNKSLPMYGDGQNVRDWIHVLDHCGAIDRILHEGKVGEVYNIGGSSELTNLELVKRLLKLLGRPETLISFVKDRPGHDRRYAMDTTKLARELEWKPSYSFESGLNDTVQWYRDHEKWWERIVNGEYKHYYDLMYGNR